MKKYLIRETAMQSKFTRGKKKKIKKEKKTWLDPNYDVMFAGKKRPDPPTEEESFKEDIAIAQKMLKDFQWRAWMADFIDEQGKPKSFKEYKKIMKRIKQEERE